VRLEDGISSCSESLELTRQLLKLSPNDPDLLSLFCKNQTRIGSAYSGLARPLEAVACFEEALPIAQQLFEDDPENLLRRFGVTDLCSMHALNLMMVRNFDAASRSYLRLIALLEPLEPATSEDVQVRTNYYNAKLQLASIEVARQQPDKALAKLNEVEAAYQRLIDAEPNRLGFRLRMGAVQDALSNAYFSLGDFQTARAKALKSIEQFETAISMDPSALVQKSQIASTWARIADIELRRGDLSAGRDAIANVIENLKPLIEPYQMQAFAQVFDDWMLMVDAVQGDASTTQEKVEAVRRSLTVLAEAHRDKFDVLNDQYETLLGDIAAAGASTKGNLLAKWLAVSLGQAYQWQTVNNVSQPILDQTSTRCLEAIQSYLALPNAEPTFPNTDPAFKTIRNLPEFADAFPVP
ncbi:MAG: hypothetical protein AAGJ83_01400, partial [Planctomycetota bacterium]